MDVYYDVEKYEPVIQETNESYVTERGKPMPSWNHSELEVTLVEQLLPFKSQFSIKLELSLELIAGKATPDLCLYPKKTSDALNDIIRMQDAPLMTVEILSPKQALDDIISKIKNIYMPSGVQSCWIVIPPMKIIHIFTPDNKIQTFTTGMVKDPATGVEISMEALFENFV